MGTSRQQQYERIAQLVAVVERLQTVENDFAVSELAVAGLRRERERIERLIVDIAEANVAEETERQ